jgi:division protein CdvB (Snf7/Vps24/ESCRT-III family)
MDLHEIVRSLNKPLTTRHIEELEALLPELQTQRDITQRRLSQVQQRPSTRRGHSRANDRFETQREAMQEISAYLATLDLTIARIQRVVQCARQEAISQQFTQDLRSGRMW